MSLADRLAVMNDGRIAGIGPPRELYESPTTPFVASFLGRSNALRSRVVDRDPPTVEIGGGTARLPAGTDPGDPGDTVVCHVRPDDVALATGAGGEDGARRVEDADADDADEVDDDGLVTLPGVVRRVADVGRRYDVTLELDGGGELVAERRARPPEPGRRVRARIRVDDVTVFDREGTERT